MLVTTDHNPSSRASDVGNTLEQRPELMKTNRIARRLTAAALFVVPAALIGCSSSSGPRHAGDIDSIRSDPTPALHMLAQRSTDRWNDHARMKDQNLRIISEDIDHIFFLDRPSRLHHGVKP